MKNKHTEKNRLKRLKIEMPLHLMLIPGIIIVFIYSYLPMFGIVMAFQKFNPVLSFWKSPFIGFANFRYIFCLPNFTKVLCNTLYLSFAKIIMSLLVPLILALLINEISRSWFKRMVQTAIFLPFFLSWAVLGGIVRELFSLQGIINRIYQLLPGVGEPIFFMASNFWFPVILITTDVWKGMGYNCIIFLAALTAINPNIYEAAAVDGCNRWKQTWHITLPGMRPIIILLATLSIGSLLNAGFEQVFMLYSPMVYESADIIDTLVYRLGLINGQLAPAAAMGLFKSVISLLLVGVSYYMAYRYSDYRIF